MSLIQSREFRNTVLRVLVKLYMGLATPDFINVCQCLIFLDDPQAVADILEKLVKSDEDTVLMAYQIGFDLYESATQQFLGRIQTALRAALPTAVPVEKEKEKEKEKEGETKETEKKEGEDAMDTEETVTPPTPAVKVEELVN